MSSVRQKPGVALWVCRYPCVWCITLVARMEYSLSLVWVHFWKVTLHRLKYSLQSIRKYASYKLCKDHLPVMTAAQMLVFFVAFHKACRLNRLRASHHRSLTCKSIHFGDELAGRGGRKVNNQAGLLVISIFTEKQISNEK